jgi:hypothetical protein
MHHLETSVRTGARRAGTTVVMTAVVAVLFVIAAMAALTAMIIELAPRIGLSWSLVVAAASSAGAGTILLFVTRRRVARSNNETNRSAEPSMGRRRAAARSRKSMVPGLVGLADELTDLPLLGSAAFAVLSVLGPTRTLRLASRAASAIGLAAAVYRNIESVSRRNGERDAADEGCAADGSRSRPNHIREGVGS